MNASYRLALERIKTVQAKTVSDDELQSMILAKEEVLARYRPVFSLNRIGEMTEVDFRSFLYFENNKHWTGLHRQASHLTRDMGKLKEALRLLLDESRPIADRFDEAVEMVKGLGKALATAILLVAYPDEYGVWNNVSEESLKRLEIWPDFERGLTGGRKYEQINAILKKLASDLGADLWTLDSLFWGMLKLKESGEDTVEDLSDRGREGSQHFGLERHLHEFLRDNWSLTELGKEWDLYSEPGDELSGYEYPTDVGRIDLLAKHRKKPEWLVIELKRGQSTDKAIGQVLRYMGWVKQHMAEPGETVRGLIISRTVDPAMVYALSAIAGTPVRVMEYRVDFRLTETGLVE